MLELKDEEDTQPSMNLDMTRLMAFCCENFLNLELYDQNQIEITKKNLIKGTTKRLLVLNFSDLYYPKNLLRVLKEKLQCPTD